MLTSAIARNDAGVFLRDLTVTACRAIDWHSTGGLYGTERGPVKSIACERQVRVPASFGDEVLPLGGFMRCSKKPAELGITIVDFSKMPTIGGLSIQGAKHGVATTRDLAINRAQGREAFRGLTNSLWLILGRAAVGVQPQLASIGTGRRRIHITMSGHLLRYKQCAHQC